jgi:hypothetical protein
MAIIKSPIMQGAQIEKPIRVIFSDKNIFEFTQKQYLEIQALIIEDLCKNCSKNLPLSGNAKKAKD